MAIVDLRYGRALAQVVAEQHLDAADVTGKLRAFDELLTASPELFEVLDNPSIPEPQKLGVLDAIASRNEWPRALRNFIAVVVKHGRIGEFDELVSAVSTAADEQGHIAEAEITTAHPLDQENRSLLEQQVAKLAGGDQVKATYREDASLLGGAVIKLGSTVYDGSVRAQLEQMKQRLVSAR